MKISYRIKTQLSPNELKKIALQAGINAQIKRINNIGFITGSKGGISSPYWTFKVDLSINPFTKKYQARGKTGRLINTVCPHGLMKFDNLLHQADTNSESTLNVKTADFIFNSTKFDSNFVNGENCTCFDVGQLPQEYKWMKNAKELIKWATSNLEDEFVNRKDLSANLIEELAAELSSIKQTWLISL